MTDFLKIYTDRLLNGEVEIIEETAPSQLISINEKELKFKDPILLLGKAFLANDYLIIELKIETIAQLPCAICNATVAHTICIPSFRHIECLANIKGQVHRYGDCIREAILLEVPFYVECLGSCPKRPELKKYLMERESQFPFADLN